MADDNLSFLDQTPEQPAPAAAPENRARDEQGRFAAKGTGDSEPSVELTPAPAAASPAAEPQDRHMVPLSVLLEERKALREQLDRERGEFTRRQDEIARQLEQMRQPRREAVQPPDPNEDLPGYLGFVQMQQQAALDNQEAQFSEMIARQKHGDDAVNEALQAAQQARVVQQFTNGPDRWDRLVRWHKQQTVAAGVGDLSSYRERLKAELRDELLAEMGAQAQPAPARPATPPPSMAAAPGATAPSSAPAGSGFDRAFR